MKPLSQQLAELSVQAKNAENSITKAQTEAKERLQQKREQARQQTEHALEVVNQQFQQLTGDARTRFEATKFKVNSDFEQLKQRARESKQKLEAWQAANYAEDKETDARIAIDYAIAATKFAELATLDAIDARAQAEIKAEQVQPVVTA